MREDIQRVENLKRSVFVFVFDPQIYKSFSDEKFETRGRKAIANEWFNTYFPKIADIPRREWKEVKAPTITIAAQRYDYANGPIVVIGEGSSE